MQKRKWISWAIGTSLVSSGLFVVPANAEPNLSDITGTNIWNNTAPIFRGNGKLDPEIVNEARRLSQELDDAAARCCNTAAAPVLPRRFARQPGNGNQNCNNSNCDQLSSAVSETKDFLDDVNRVQTEQVRANRNRTW